MSLLDLTGARPSRLWRLGRANLLERAPVGGIEQWHGRTGDRHGVDRGDPVPGFGMVEQDFNAPVLVGDDAGENSTERMRIAARPLHQIDAVGVRRGLDAAGIGRFQDGPGGDDDGAAADKIAEHHAEQKRQAGGLQHGAGAVAVRDMTDLMRQYAGELVGRLREAVSASQSYLRLARSQYKYGLTDYLLVIDAERTLLANQLLLAQTINLQMGASVHLIKALGGGWEGGSRPATPRSTSSPQTAE